MWIELHKYKDGTPTYINVNRIEIINRAENSPFSTVVFSDGYLTVIEDYDTIKNLLKGE